MRRLFQIREGTAAPSLRARDIQVPKYLKRVSEFLRAQVLPCMVPEGLQAVGCLLMTLGAQGLLMNSMSPIRRNCLHFVGFRW